MYLLCTYVGSCKENEVFKKFYAKLVSILPIDKISPKLISAEIITIDDLDEIDGKTTSSKKASYILKNIGKSLKAGITSSFYGLLEVMEEYGGDVAILAKDIKRAVNKSSGDISLNSLF